MLAGLVFVTTSIYYIVNEKFLYLCAVISSFIGFSVGKVLDGFESLNSKKINKLFAQIAKDNSNEQN